MDNFKQNKLFYSSLIAVGVVFGRRWNTLVNEGNQNNEVGLPLTHLVEKQRSVRVSYADLQAKPHRFVNSPMWSGLIENGRAVGVEYRTPAGLQTARARLASLP